MSLKTFSMKINKFNKFPFSLNSNMKTSNILLRRTNQPIDQTTKQSQLNRWKLKIDFHFSHLKFSRFNRDDCRTFFFHSFCFFSFIFWRQIILKTNVLSWIGLLNVYNGWLNSRINKPLRNNWISSLKCVFLVLIQSYAMKIQFLFHFSVFGLCQQNRNATLIFVVCSIWYLFFFSSLQRFILFTVGFSVYNSRFQSVCVCCTFCNHCWKTHHLWLTGLRFQFYFKLLFLFDVLNDKRSGNEL